MVALTSLGIFNIPVKGVHMGSLLNEVVRMKGEMTITLNKPKVISERLRTVESLPSKDTITKKLSITKQHVFESLRLLTRNYDE